MKDYSHHSMFANMTELQEARYLLSYLRAGVPSEEDISKLADQLIDSRKRYDAYCDGYKEGRKDEFTQSLLKKIYRHFSK